MKEGGDLGFLGNFDESKWSRMMHKLGASFKKTQPFREKKHCKMLSFL